MRGTSGVSGLTECVAFTILSMIVGVFFTGDLLTIVAVVAALAYGVPFAKAMAS